MQKAELECGGLSVRGCCVFLFSILFRLALTPALPPGEKGKLGDHCGYSPAKDSIQSKAANFFSTGGDSAS